MESQRGVKTIDGHRHRPQCRRYPTSTSIIPISEETMSDWKLSFRYRKSSDINIRVHYGIRYPKNIYHISRIRTQNTCFLSNCDDLWIFGCQISDKSLFRYPIKCRIPLSSVRYRKFRYQAQSDIADRGFRSKCPPMVKTHAKWFVTRNFFL